MGIIKAYATLLGACAVDAAKEAGRRISEIDVDFPDLPLLEKDNDAIDQEEDAVIFRGEKIPMEDLLDENDKYYKYLPETATRRYHYPGELAENGILEQNLSPAKRKEREKWKQMLICSNCGAPLRRVYAECEYCGVKHLPT